MISVFIYLYLYVIYLHISLCSLVVMNAVPHFYSILYFCINYIIELPSSVLHHGCCHALFNVWTFDSVVHFINCLTFVYLLC